jgi:hypothetical protein
VIKEINLYIFGIIVFAIAHQALSQSASAKTGFYAGFPSPAVHLSNALAQIHFLTLYHLPTVMTKKQRSACADPLMHQRSSS